MATNDVSVLRVVGRFQDQNIVNTLHYKHTAQTSGETSVLNNLVTGWETNVKSDWLACHHGDYDLIGVKAFTKAGASKTPGVNAIGESGTRIGTAMPAFNCRTITLYTADEKFRRRGRLMLSGASDGDFETSDGSLSSAILTLLATLGATIVDPFDVSGDEFTPGIPASGADVFQAFTDAKARETPSCVTSRRIREFFIG